MATKTASPDTEQMELFATTEIEAASLDAAYEHKACTRCGSKWLVRPIILNCSFALLDIVPGMIAFGISGCLQPLAEWDKRSAGYTPIYAQHAVPMNRPKLFYSLLACRKCRMEFVSALSHWFENPPPPAEQEPDGGE